MYSSLDFVDNKAFQFTTSLGRKVVIKINKAFLVRLMITDEGRKYYLSPIEQVYAIDITKGAILIEYSNN